MDDFWKRLGSASDDPLFVICFVPVFIALCVFAVLSIVVTKGAALIVPFAYVIYKLIKRAD